MRKHVSRIHAVSRHIVHRLHVKDSSSLFIAIAALFLMLFVGITGTNAPNTDSERTIPAAELAFADLSPKGESAGKIIPASCESGIEHTPGICGPTCVVNVGTECSVPNACGQANSGYIQCDGMCGLATPYPVDSNGTYWSFPAGHPGSNDSYPTPGNPRFGPDTCNPDELNPSIPYQCPAGANATCEDSFQSGQWVRNVTCRSDYTAVSAPACPVHILTVTKDGTGSGTITSSPAGISCGVDCSEPYTYDTLVTLTATPDVGSSFAYWSGACSASGICTVSMTAANSVTATFSAQPPSMNNVTISAPSIVANGSNQYTITVYASDPAGGGNIGSEYALINHQGINTGAYRGYLGWSTQGFPYWGGAYKVGPIGCAGGGAGSIASGGGYGPEYVNLISCSTAVLGNTRTASFVVTFNSNFTSPTSGNTLSGYAHNNQNQPVGWFPFETFSLAPPLTVTKSGTGSGTVTSNPAGINCGVDCSENYTAGTFVTLSANASADSTFSGWNGAGCSGTGMCTVGMNDIESVDATFTFNVGCTIYGTDPAGDPTIPNIDSYDRMPAEQNEKYRVTKWPPTRCFGNTSSSRYLVPLGSQLEFDSFWNRIENGSSPLPGLYRIP